MPSPDISTHPSESAVFNLLKNKPGSVHMLGIGGVGMAGVALMLSRSGWSVSGCDAYAGPLLSWLEQQGITCKVGHDASHMDRQPEFLVRSPAVHWTQPELQRALLLEIPVIDRGRLLPELLKPYQSIAVAGTHGKTTTASMVAWCLKHAGAKTSYCIGGVCQGLGSVAHVEKDGWMVVEADESDGTLRYYAPSIAVITSMDMDHVDFFQDEKTLLETYGTFARSAGWVVYPANDLTAAALLSSHPATYSIGIDIDSDVSAVNPVLTADQSTFGLRIKGKDVAKVNVGVPGRHNILNALSAIAVLQHIGIELNVFLPAFADFQLPQRRFELVAECEGRVVISDYAHHPVEIAALLAQARLRKAKRLIAVFQPHRYSRTKAFVREFAEVLGTVDQLILVPVYAASEPFMEGGTSEDIMKCMIQQTKHHVSLATSVTDAWHKLKELWQEGDLVLIIGAGDVDLVAKWAGEELKTCGESV